MTDNLKHLPYLMRRKLKAFIRPANIKRWLPIAIIIAIASTSFVYGWYVDDSKPVSGVGWADQDTYHETANKLYDGESLQKQDFHYSVGYPILGSIGILLSRADPYVAVSYLLFIASIIFCFLGSRRMLGAVWSIFFMALLLFWDGTARTFNYVPELFTVPWNNQVLFFAMSFYFWLFTTRIVNKQPSWGLIVALGVVSGYTVLTREEAILFVLPAAIAYLWLVRAKIIYWVVTVLIAAVCFLPQPILKNLALGGLTESGRSSTYADMTKQYLQPSLLFRNIWEVVVDPGHYGTTPFIPAGAPEGYDNLFRRGGDAGGRQSILQSSPWLWLAPLGAILILVLGRYSAGVKVFCLISGFLLIFYLSGVNMSAHKLKFHAIRYVTPGLIMLNLASVVVVREGWIYTRQGYVRKLHPRKHGDVEKTE